MNEQTGRLLIQMKFSGRKFYRALKATEKALLDLETGGSIDLVIDTMNTMAEAEAAFDEAAVELQGLIEITVDSNADPKDLTQNQG
jgi:D-serine deaminase-like pyridoxal phosphate-dependent protein